MRSTLLVIASCLVLLTAFLVYSSMQSGKFVHGGSGHGAGDPPPPVLGKQESWNGIKPGQGAWFNTYDEKGVLKNRFRADDYKPQANGTIEVTSPVAEFFMPNHQMMRLTGKTGEVVMPEASHTAQNSIGDFGGGSPDRGEIDDVTIQMFNLFPDSNAKIPDETIKTNNVHFDNATRLITTEGYRDPSGRMIARDQVPVHMTSDNDHRGYDFDGKGLTLRWNDADGRLDLLQVAHGQELVVKDTSSSSGGFGGGVREKKSPTPVSAAPVAGAAALGPAQLPGDASSSPAPQPPGAQVAAARQGPTPATSTTQPPAAPIPYVTTFYDNVRITQGDDVLITANRMDLDFVSRQKQEAAATTAPSAGQPGTSAPSEVSAPADGTLAATQPAATQSLVSAAPTTRPSSPPVVVRWTGKLVMLSAQANRPKVTPGDAIVDLTGDPVTVRRTPAGQQEGDDVRAARLIYHTGDGSVKLVNSQTVPQVVISKLLDKKVDPMSTVTTSTLDYATDPAGRKFALLTGPGHATMPMQARDQKPADAKNPAMEMMDTHWEKEARVYFLGKGQDEQTVDHADLAGDVDVKHPQLAMQCQALSLFFAPPAPATRPSLPTPTLAEGNTHAAKPAGEKPQQELKRVFARQEVHCVMAGQNGKQQTIDCDDLEMLTARSADGKFFARQVNAHGSVHAFDPSQDLRAGVVELTLKPAQPKPEVANHPQTQPTELAQTRPAKAESDSASAELEKMTARENVTVRNNEGSTASGSVLTITTENNQNHIRLTGSPLATVIDAKQNTTVGPLIIVEQGVAHVVGAGNMHVLQEQADGAKPRPMDITWTKQADMNGKGNRVDIAGEVSVTTYDADGTVNVANGDLVQIDLVDKPAPATRPVVGTGTRGHGDAETKPEFSGPSTRLATQDADLSRTGSTALIAGSHHSSPQADSMQMDVMKDKQASRITIDGNAQVVSTLHAADGTVARQFALYGPTIFYQLLDSKELPAKTLLVPHAGRMYVGDHRPPEKPKAGEKAEAGDDDSGGRGDTAFQWSKQLIYGEVQREAIISGDVLVVHQPLGKQADEDRVRINADRMTATFEPQKHEEKPASAAKPATEPAVPPTTRPVRAGEPGESLQLKHLTADGHVVITRSTGSILYAERVDFDPLTHWMTAHGGDNNPARYVDADPTKRPVTARDMEWNTQTWNMKMSDPKAVNPK